jgi:hypothetical protein
MNDLRNIPGLISWSGGYPFWDGGPSKQVTDAIKMLTETDSHGRRYYRLQVWEAWRRLRAKDRAAYAALNKAIDRYRLPAVDIEKPA